MTTLSSLLASATAGVFARFPCHPLDTAKARLQAQQPNLGATPRYRSLVDTLRKTLQKDGLRGLYRGFGITVVGSAPATCLYLTTYDQASKYLTTSSSFLRQNDFVAHFLSGMIAEALSCVLWVPIDVVKERLQIQEKGGAGNYRGSTHALSTIMRTEGLSGIYRGYAATLASFGPFSALYFTFYEKIKAFSFGLFLQPTADGTSEVNGGSDVGEEARQKTVNDVPFLLHLVNSSLASAMASFVTNPLDLVKMRLQIQRGAAALPSGASAPSWEPYTGITDGLAKIVRQDGVPGLFRGVGARMAFHGPTTAITIAAYETLKGTWSELLQEKDEW